MHHPNHTPRISGHNLPVQQTHNPSINYAAVPNASLHSTQNNQKYMNNIGGNVGGPPVVQYNRFSNQQINNFHKIRQQHQQIIHKKPPPLPHQYQQHPAHSHSGNHFQQRNQIHPPLRTRPLPKEQLHHSEIALGRQFQPVKNDAACEMHSTTTLGIKTNPIPMLPVPNIQIKKRPINARLQIPDADNEKAIQSCKEDSANITILRSSDVNSFNKIEKPVLMANTNIITTTTTIEESPKIPNTNTNLEQSCPPVEHVEHEVKKLDQVLTDTDDKTEEDAENTDNLNPLSSKSTREKTPMCLINDLARFNKISFQYRLTSESGPAHGKRFTVTLKLGDEEYTAEGFKIKQAQHLAAKEAIEKTKYKHPIPKTNRQNDNRGVMRTNVTPTVELNALAMKLGQQTYYIFDPREMASSENVLQNENGAQANYKNAQLHESNGPHMMSPRSVMVHNLDHNQMLRSGNYNAMVQNLHHNGQRSYKQGSYLPKIQLRYPTFQESTQNGIIPTSNPLFSTLFPPSAPCKITLIVGTQKFVGIGRTVQQAKHDAASKALSVLKEQINLQQQNEEQEESFDENDSKSPISLVFEIGIKRNLPVDFKVLREEGPAHMRTFTTACIVGEIMTEGEGTGKKISKKKAAQKMLDELKKLPPLTPVASPVKRIKIKPTGKKYEKVINPTEAKEEQPPPQRQPWNKTKKINTDTDASNPITKLTEWHQHQPNKEKELVFKVISELGKENSRRRQFVMEVSSNNMVARGVGNSKKLAKRDAAQNFLTALGIDANDTTIQTVNENHEISIGNINYNVKNEEKVSQGKVAQMVSLLSSDTLEVTKKSNPPEEMNEGIILPSQNKKVLKKKKPQHEIVEEKEINETEETVATSKPNISNEPKSSDNISAPIIEKKNEASTNSLTNTTNSSVKSSVLHMKDQLLYLAKLMGFEVDFSDYPKGNHNEFLTIVMLSTNPPQICHGVGVNAMESQEDAAKNALKILSEMGLNNAMKTS